MIQSIIQLLIPVARIVDRESGSRWERRVLELRETIYYEENKPIQERDDGIIHDSYNSIMRICETLGNSLEKQETKIP